MKPTKRGKRWEIAYRIPGYLRIFHESFTTEAEANVRCAEIALAKELGNLEPPQQDTKKRRRKLPTLNEFLIEYVNNYGVKRWGDSQYSVCVRQFRLYVNPHPIGSRLITHISTKDIDQFYTDLMKMPAALRKGERDRGKTVGPSVIEKLHRSLKAAFNYAIKQGYITLNPVMAATLPEYEKKVVKVWEPQEARLALDSCRNRTLKVCMLLAIGGSLRIGEILGLQWDQVNVSPETIENGTSTVSVRQEQKRCEKEALEVLDAVGRSKVYFRFPERKAECSTVLVLKAPKTSSSVRTVYISKTVAEALLELKAEQERQKEALHGLYEDYDMVIAQSNGRPMERRLVEKQFREHITRQKLPQVVFHSLRHFSTSMKLALCGDIKAVQGDTGHATADMVTGVYGHTFVSNRQQLAEEMETHFFQTDMEMATDGEKLKKLAAIVGEKPELLDLLLAVAG